MVDYQRKRFLLIGGYVLSRHYISARELVRLYNLDPRLCVFDDHEEHYWLPRGVDTDWLIVLHPRNYGDYKGISALDVKWRYRWIYMN